MILAFWLACSQSPVAGIVALPEPLVLDGLEPVRPGVFAVDLDQRQLPDFPVRLGEVRGDAVVVEGDQVRCVADGVALVMLEVEDQSEHLSRELEVQCRVVKEVRAPERIFVQPGPYTLGAQAIGQDGAPVDLALTLSSEDPAVATPERALKPGRTVVTARVGEREARVEVVVGQEVLREEVALQPGETRTLPLEPGRYLARVEGELATRLFFEGTECGWMQGERAEVECALGQAQPLKVQAITTEPARTELVVFRLDEGAVVDGQ